VAAAGCTGLFETRAANAPPVVEDRPDGSYHPTHVEGMEMIGTAASGSYRCALTYTYPHRFWLVTGSRRRKVEIDSEDSVHLMPVVRDADAGVVLPDVNPQLSVTRDGGAVTELSPWPMLSQPMGFHFGDNVRLDGDGSYRVEVSVGEPSARRTGSLAEAPASASFAFDFEFERSTLDGIPYRDVPDERQGTEGAVEPMEMEMLSGSRAPAERDLPGRLRGSVRSGDAVFVATTLDDATAVGGDGDETYLAVSPRTAYNRYALPMMSLAATVTRGGDSVYEGRLRTTIGPDLQYHYGTVVPGIESGDELTIAVDAPPQVARHEGYETAFFGLADATVTL